jgi:hypothetical protein
VGITADCRPRPVEPQYGIIAEAMSPRNEPQQHRHTMNKNLLYAGLDVHAQTVSIALAEPGGEVRNYGAVSSGRGKRQNKVIVAVARSRRTASTIRFTRVVRWQDARAA